MRTRLTSLALLAGLAFAAWAPAANAQTMTFRPVPRESLAVESQGTSNQVRDLRRGVNQAVREATRDIARRGSEAAASGAAGVVVEVPPAPEPPDPPEPPTISTTGEIIRFGQDIHVSEDQTVQGDVVAMGGDVTIEGKVTGSVTAMGGDVHLMPGARVDQDVVCLGGTLVEEPGATVGGQRVTAPRSSGAQFMLPFLGAIGAGFEIMGKLLGVLFLLGLSWLVVKLAPGRTKDALSLIERDGGAAFMMGLLLWALIIPSVIMLAIAMALLCITIIGIPLAAALAVAYVAFFVIAAFWGSVIGHTLIGGLLHGRFRGPAPSLGVAVIWGVLAVEGLTIAAALFGFLPIFGFVGGLMKFVYIVLSLVLVTLGAGSLVLSEYRKQSVQRWWARVRPSTPMRGPDPPPPPPPAAPSEPPAGI